MVVTQFLLPTVEIQLPPRFYIESGRVSEAEFYSLTRRPNDGVGMSLIDTRYKPPPIDLK